MKPLKAGIIGLGVGEAHIQGYLEAGVEVLGICDLDETRLKEVKVKYPSISVLTAKANDLLIHPEIDIVSIASFDNDHASQILLGLENNKHLFVEKPLCLDTKEAKEIRAALDSRPNLHISSNLILRKSPRFERVRSLIKKGRLGELFHLEGDYNYGRIHKITSGWRGTLPNYSVTLGGGVHLIDLLLWMTGERVASVQAIGTRIATRGTQVKFPDTVTAILSFQSGATGKITSNYSCVYPHFHKVSLYGTEGTFENDLGFGKLFTERDSATFNPITEEYRPAGKHLLISPFVNFIQGKSTEDNVSTEDVFEVLSVCFAIDEAWRTGKTVDVEYI